MGDCNPRCYQPIRHGKARHPMNRLLVCLVVSLSCRLARCSPPGRFWRDVKVSDIGIDSWDLDRDRACFEHEPPYHVRLDGEEVLELAPQKGFTGDADAHLGTSIYSSGDTGSSGDSITAGSSISGELNAAAATDSAKGVQQQRDSTGEHSLNYVLHRLFYV